jgi:hypothetical protein
MARITAQVLRGQYAGVELTPHRYPNGAFRVSLSSNKAADAVDVFSEDELVNWLRKGYGVRMSGDGVAPSIYTSKSVRIQGA